MVVFNYVLRRLYSLGGEKIEEDTLKVAVSVYIRLGFMEMNWNGSGGPRWVTLALQTHYADSTNQSNQPGQARCQQLLQTCSPVHLLENSYQSLSVFPHQFSSPSSISLNLRHFCTYLCSVFFCSSLLPVLNSALLPSLIQFYFLSSTLIHRYST